MPAVECKFEKALELLQKQVYLKTKTNLCLQEEAILKGAWEDLSYQEIAESLYLSGGYIRILASSLWKKVSEILKCKVTKAKFREIMCIILENKNVDIKKNMDNFYEDDNEIAEFRGTVLIVDDLLENLQLLSKLLKQNGYQVKSANNGKLALLFLENNLPDLILLDILMPDLSGYEVCKIIKSKPNLQQIPIIFLSSLDGTLDKVKAFQLGGSDYITKPFESQEVLARVSSQVTLHKQEKQLNQEIQEHQQTIQLLYQSRSILASILNHTCYGIAAFEAIRSEVDAEIIDFRCLLVNPIFAQFFNLNRRQLTKQENCANLFQENGLNWLEKFIEIVQTGTTFEEIFNYKGKFCKIFVVKLGDGVTVNLQCLDQ